MDSLPPAGVRAAPFVVAALVLACNDPAGSDTPYIVTPVTTAALSGTAGYTLSDTLVIEVRDAEGHLVPGAQVHWSLPQGGSLAVQLADVSDRMTGTADDHGRSYAVWTLGLPEGEQRALAEAGGGEPAAFTATATVLHAVSVSVGEGYVCALLADQRPVCWGSNNHFGQLGTGDTVARASPTRVAGLPAVQEIRASADGHTCARDLAGDVWCWGRNFFGEAGPAGVQPRQLSPVRVAGAEGAISISLSTSQYGYTCAVLGAGGAKCWGYNLDGQLGTGDRVSSSSPQPVLGSGGFTRIYSGENRSCALDGSGEAWCWGKADAGELAPLPRGTYLAPVRPVPGVVYTSLAVGAYSVCGIQLGGVATCFGSEFGGSLGRWLPEGQYETTSPVQPDFHESLAQLVSDGWNGMYARSRYGQGFMWGETCCDVYTVPPAMITPGIRLTDLASGPYQYCGLSETGGVYCGRVGWWAWSEKDPLQGIPDDTGS
jgi:hypothetical protein